MKKKLLSLLLCIAMMASLAVPAMAAEPAATETPVTTTAETTTAAPAEGHWADETIATWKDRKIINGYADGSFKPDQNITRGEFAAILNNLMVYQKQAENTYGDLKADAWYTKAVLSATAAGVLQGDGVNVRPEADITRQEAAVIFARTMKLTGLVDDKATYTDLDSVATWAKDAVLSMAAKGYMTGNDGVLRPADKITRAEVLTIIDNIFAGYFAEAKTVTGDVAGSAIVNVPGVTLKNMKISGDLVISEGVGTGDFTMTNVQVGGKLIVRGGGENSIHIKGKSTVAEVSIDCRGGNVRVVASNGAEVEVVYIEDGKDDVIIEGTFANVTVDGNAPLTLKNATVGTVTATGKDADITVDSKSAVKTVATKAENTKITVAGTVANVAATKEATGVSLDVKKGGTATSVTTAAAGSLVKNDGKVGAIAIAKGADTTYAKGTNANKPAFTAEDKTNLNVTTIAAQEAQAAAAKAEADRLAAEKLAAEAKTDEEKAAAQAAADQAAADKVAAEKAQADSKKEADKVKEETDKSVVEKPVTPPAIKDDGGVTVPDEKPAPPSGGGGGGGTVTPTPTPTPPTETVSGIVPVKSFDQDSTKPVINVKTSASGYLTHATGIITIDLSTDKVLRIHKNTQPAMGTWVGFGIEAPADITTQAMFTFGTTESDTAATAAGELTTGDPNVGGGAEGKHYLVAYVNATSLTPKTHLTIDWDGAADVYAPQKYVINLDGVRTAVTEITNATISQTTFPTEITSTAEGLSRDESAELPTVEKALAQAKIKTMGGGGELVTYYTIPKTNGTIAKWRISVNGGAEMVEAIPTAAWSTSDETNYYAKAGLRFADKTAGNVFSFRDNGVFAFSVKFTDAADNLVATLNYTLNMPALGYTITPPLALVPALSTNAKPAGAGTGIAEDATHHLVTDATTVLAQAKVEAMKEEANATFVEYWSIENVPATWTTVTRSYTGKGESVVNADEVKATLETDSRYEVVDKTTYLKFGTIFATKTDGVWTKIGTGDYVETLTFKDADGVALASCSYTILMHNVTITPPTADVSNIAELKLSLAGNTVTTLKTNLTISEAITIPVGKTLVIPADKILTIAASQTLTVQGILDNKGGPDALVSAAGTIIVKGDASVVVQGNVVLFGAAAGIIELTGAESTITLAKKDGKMNYTIAGMAEVLAGKTLPINDSASLTIANEAVLTVSGVLANAGGITAGTGTIAVKGTMINKDAAAIVGFSGTLKAVGTSSLITLETETVNKNIIGPDSLHITKGAATIAMAGVNTTITIPADTEATIAGKFWNEGSYRLAHNDTMSVAGKLTIDFDTTVSGDLNTVGTGSIIVNAGKKLELLTAVCIGKISNAGTITNNGTITVGAGSTITNTGTISNEAGSTFTSADQLANLSKTDGKFIVKDTAKVTNGFAFVNATAAPITMTTGTITMTGADAALNLKLEGAATIAAGKTFTLLAGHTAEIATGATLTIPATATLDNKGAVTVNGTIANAGILTVSGAGQLDVNDGGVLTVTGFHLGGGIGQGQLVATAKYDTTTKKGAVQVHQNGKLAVGALVIGKEGTLVPGVDGTVIVKTGTNLNFIRTEGAVTLAKSLELKAAAAATISTLAVREGSTLTIPNGVVLTTTNPQTVIIDGTLEVQSGGSLVNDATQGWFSSKVGSTIKLDEGAKVTCGLVGTLQDGAVAVTTTTEITVSAAATPAAATGLSAGNYVWSVETPPCLYIKAAV